MGFLGRVCMHIWSTARSNGYALNCWLCCAVHMSKLGLCRINRK